MALAWPLDKYEALTVDTSRVAETRKWGRGPREGLDYGTAKPPTSPTTTSTEVTENQPTVSGVKRPRETNRNADKNKGEQEPENPWQVRL